jgi:L-serine dehydratase
MRIAKTFLSKMSQAKFEAARISVTLHGSLALTGRGHNTDGAVVLGLAGSDPESVDVDRIPYFLAEVKKTGRLKPYGMTSYIDFNWDRDIAFDPECLPLHENGMVLRAYSANEEIFTRTYYSIGGGFFCREDSLRNPPSENDSAKGLLIPYPFNTATDLIRMCGDTGLSISGLMLRNEIAIYGKDELHVRLGKIREVMQESMDRGMNAEGLLPGPLRVPRRAIGLRYRLQASNSLSHDPMNIIDWVNMFAFAVSEENAAGGRVVTAPTNGACGIVPAVLAYYDKFVCPAGYEIYSRYFLAGGAIGAIFKTNASISGAEVGCQGEVGVACSMASAGLAELMGGSPEQVCTAAEIAMEHNLGLTCDPIGGLVQVPCIERNAIMSVKAINSARMAMSRTTPPRVSLDKVVETMYETGRDMNAKYRETSQGGLAKNIKCE